MSLSESVKHDILLIVTVALVILLLTGIENSISPSQFTENPTIIN